MIEMVKKVLERRIENPIGVTGIGIAISAFIVVLLLLFDIEAQLVEYIAGVFVLVNGGVATKIFRQQPEGAE